MSDDDDLPVLTHVLRVGTVRRSAIDERHAAGQPDAAAEAPLLAEPLVIGNDPHPAISAYLAPTEPDTTEGGADAHPAVDDPSEDDDTAADTRAPDAFLLPQDHDGAATARRSTLAVPALVASTPPAAQPAMAPAEDPAVLARRIRDAVVDDLRTRIDTELDARIAQALHAEVETVLAQLQQNLRARLSDALRDVVAKAVDETIAGRSNGEAPVA